MAVKNGTAVYVYTLGENGRVVEREGILMDTRGAKSVRLAVLRGGQKVCLPGRQSDIRNDMMWSERPMKNVYINKMREVLVERRHIYEERLLSINKRIAALNQYDGR